uniref:Predicted protein n=1 Tax=Physcomitrium patens TaxID=3218 RepID=A9TUX9_PHYPA
MELNQVSEKKKIKLFGLATIPEIRDHITSITDCYGNSWEVFSHALKDEYFLKDVDRITKKLFLKWIERPNKNLQAIELLREFERQYSQLSKVEKLTLEPNKVDLFLQAADGELQEKLEPLLEDKEEDEGLTMKWKNVEDAVGLLTKKERRKDRSNIPKTVQAPKAPVRTTPPTMPTVQPSTSLSKKADMRMEEIIRGMRDLQIKLARLEENTSINNSKNVSKQRYVQRCIWCDDASHTRKDCNEFNNMIRQRIIWWKDGKIALKDRNDLLQTNFGKGGMRALVQDYLKEHETIARESASYGARVDDDLGGSTETKRILNAKVEFTLKEVLKIAKKEFHDVIIDSIKRKRQLMGETGMSHAIDARIYKDEEEVDIGYKQLTNEKNMYNQRVHFEDSSDKEMETLSHYTRKHWAKVTTEVLVKVGDIEEPIVALVDHGSEINLMSKDLYKKQKWPIDMEHGWAIRAANNTRGELYGACPDVKIRIGDVATEQHFFVQDTTSYSLILGQPYITAIRMETKVLDDGFAYTKVGSEDGRKVVQFLTVPPNHERNQDRLREKPLPKIVEGFKDFGENGNIMYKEVYDFKRKERKRLYDIEGQLRKLGTLQDDERILGVYEENGLEDSLELITCIGEVYTMLESFQAPEVTVETRYKTADKKVKPVAGPLPKDSKEQMGEASKEASLRDPMSIGHQFTKETFEELKIGFDGSLLLEEITCFKKMLAKQGRPFAFESHEIGYLEYWEQRPTPVQILSDHVQSPRYSQSGHTEMLHSIAITRVSKKRKDHFTRRAVLFFVPFQGTLFLVKGSLKDSQWIQDREYKAVSKISSLGCLRFSVTSRDLPAGAKRTSTSSRRASV